MPQITGLSKRDVLKKYYATAIQEVENVLDNYNKNTDAIATPKKTFLGVASVVPTAIFSGFKGALNGVVDAGASIALIIQSLINDAKHIFDDSDGTNVGTDIGYTLGNFVISSVEGITNAVVSTGANLGRIFGADTDWAFGEDGVISDIAQEANQSRVSILGTNKTGAWEVKGSAEDNKKLVESRYYDGIRGSIMGTAEVQGFIKENFTNKVAEIGGFKASADEQFGNEEWYNAVIGSAESIGNILTTWALAKAGSKMGLSTTATSALTSAYFASTVFGQSFEEAINNGSSIQDAYVYATGNAFVETAIENIGGFKIGEADEVVKKSLFGKVVGAKWGEILQSAVEEGLEEVGSDIAGTGMQYYGNKDNAIEQTTTKDFISKAFFSFVGGSIASLGLGTIRDIKINSTIEGKSRRLAEDFNKSVAKNGEEKSIAVLNKDLDALINKFNDKKAQGYKLNSKDNPYIGTMTLSEKKDYIQENGLSSFVSYDGAEFVRTERAKKLDKNIFKNRVNGNVVEDGDYAVNSATRMKELSNDGYSNVVKTSELTPEGKKGLEFANTLDISVAFVNDAKENSGYFGAKNDVIYINQKSLEGKTNEQIKNIIVTHEMVHNVRKNNPELYQKIEKEVNNIVELALDENSKITLKYNDKQMEKHLESKNLKKMIVDSFEDYLLNKVSPKRAVEMAREEVVAYFMENILTGNDAYIKSISKNKKLFEGLMNKVKQDKDFKKIAEGSNKALRSLRKASKAFETASKEIVMASNSLGYYIDFFVGNKFDVKNHLFSKKFLDIYGYDFLIEEAFKNYDPSNHTIEFDNKVFKVSEVFDKVSYAEISPKRFDRGDFKSEVDSFAFDEGKRKEYVKLLKAFLVEGDAEMLEETDEKEKKKIRNAMSACEDMIETLKTNQTPKKGDRGYQELAELVYLSNQETSRKKWERKNTTFVLGNEGRAYFNTIKTIVKFFNEKTGFQGWRNRTFSSMGSMQEPSATYEVKNDKLAKEGEDIEQNAQSLANTMSVIVDVHYPDKYYIKFTVGKDSTIFECFPEADYIDEVIEKYEKRDKELQKEKDEDVENVEEIEKAQYIGVDGFKESAMQFLSEQTDLSKDEIASVSIIKPESTRNEIETIKKELDEKGIVAVVLPSAYRTSFDKQNYIPIEAKLIYNEFGGVDEYSFMDKKRNTKVVHQIWVKKSMEASAKDLRLTSNKPSRSPYFDIKIINGTSTTLESLRDSKFDFAVLSLGGAKTNFNKKFTSVDEMNSKGRYIAVRADTPQDLAILNAIDYNKLAREGAPMVQGFFAYEIVEAFNEIKESEEPVVNMKRVDKSGVTIKKSVAEIGDDKINTVRFSVDDSYLEVWANSPFANGRNSIYDFTVVESERRKGIGSRLLQSAIAYFNSTISAQVSNANSAKVHYNNGFRVTENPSLNLEETVALFNSKKSESLNMQYEYNIQGLEDYTKEEIKKFAIEFIKEQIEKNDAGIDIVGLEIIGSRAYNRSRRGSDLDIVIEYKGDMREDDVFNMLHDEVFKINGITVDFNPINARKSGTLEDYMMQNEEYEKNMLTQLTDSDGNKITREQREFFKDSKIRNDDGNLLVMYHGSSEDFTKFDSERKGANTWVQDAELGFFFTPDLESAKIFGAITKKFYLNIKKPLDVSLFERYKEGDEKNEKVREAIQNIADIYGIKFQDVIEEGAYEINMAKQVKEDLAMSSEIMERAKKLGFDGFIAHEFKGGIKEYVAFYPSQIKSVSNKKPTTDEDTMKRVQKTKELSEAEKQEISKVLNNDTIREMFEKAKDGSYRIKNERIPRKKPSDNKIKINGTVYDGKDYAVSVYVDQTQVNLSGQTPLKLYELTVKEKRLFDLMSSTDMSFVFYKAQDNALGYAHGDYVKNATVTFINTNYLVNEAKVVGTIVHETMHEMFKFKPKSSHEFAGYLANLLFKDENGVKVPTDVFNLILKQYNGVDGFIQYMNLYTSEWKISKIKKFEEFYTLLDDASKAKNVPEDVSMLFGSPHFFANEIIAQVVGYMFSDKNVLQQALGASDSVNSIQLYNMFTTITEDPHIDKNIRDYFKTTLGKYKDIFEGFKATLDKMFPKGKMYSLAELNDFIRNFTDGKISSRGELLRMMLQERATNKRGYATQVLDNIIYITSQFATNVKSATETYNTMAKEFKAYKGSIDMLLNEEHVVLSFIGSDVFKRIKTMKRSASDIAYYIKNIKNNVSLSTGVIENIIDDLHLLYDDYQNIDIRILELLDLPTLKEMSDMVDSMLVFFEDELKKAMQVDPVDGQSYLPDFYDPQDPTQLASKMVEILTFVKPLTMALKKINEGDGNFANIIKLQKEFRKNETENIANAIAQRIEKKVNSIKTSGSRESQAPFNENIKEVLARISNIVKAIRDNMYDYKTMSGDVVKELDSLRVLIGTSRDLDDEIREKLNKTMENIYVNFSALFEDKNILLNAYPQNTMFQVVSLADIKKTFSKDVVASGLVSVFNAFRTIYTTSFGGDQLTHEEYSFKVVAQIQENIDAPLKTDFAKTFNIIPPQNFLAIYRDLTKGKVDFFEDFYREYLQCAKRRSDAIRDFHVKYKEFNKKNPNNQKNSLEKVEVSEDFFIQMDKSEIQKLKNEVDKELGDYDEQIKMLKGDYDTIGDKLKEIRQKYNDQLKIRDSYIKKDPQWAIENAKLIAIAKLKKPLNEQHKKLKAGIKYYGKEKSVLSRDQRIKIKMHEYVTNSDNKRDQKMSRGQIVSLYMSIMREMEMQELMEMGVDGINPTNHFAFTQEIHAFDNELMKKKGWQYAKEHITPFVIYNESRAELAQYLGKLLNAEDLLSLEFARECFDTNYETANAIFKAKYKVDLPRQTLYIPFASNTSDYSREFELKKSGSYNAGVADGMVTETTLGAYVPLRIENIFGVVEKSTNDVANYNFERIITDFQNLLISEGNGILKHKPLGEMLTGNTSKFGADNNIIKGFESAFLGILRYGDVTEGQLIKLMEKVLRNSVIQTIALNATMFIKQTASIITISLKNGLNLANLIKNVTLSMGKSKYHRWLMKNNSNYFLRNEMGNMPNLSEQISSTFYYNSSSKVRKTVGLLTKHVGWMDRVVLVGAFKTIADDIRKNNPSLTEEEVLTQSNNKFEEVLLFGVANSDSAFRAPISNSRKWYERSISKFQSENILQIGAIIHAYALMKNNVKGSFKFFGRHSLAFIMSALFSAFVTSAFKRMRGQIEKEEQAFDLFVNEMLWNNFVGAVPIVNQFTSMIQFEKAGIKKGFEPQIPLFGDVAKLIEQSIALENGENLGTKMVKIAETLGSLTGIPVRNANKIISTVSNLIGEDGNGSAMAVTRFYQSQTPSAGFTQALKEDNRAQIKEYVEMQYDNVTVQNEIIKLLSRFPEEKISFKSAITFKKENKDGIMVEHKFTNEIKQKYNRYTQTALRALIKNEEYSKLKGTEKLKTIQRVINYYYNYSKTVVLKEKTTMLDLDKVVANAIRYAE